MKIIYVCSPLRGDMNRNISRARSYCSYVKDQNCVPVAPHLLFTQFMNDNDPSDRNLAFKMNEELLHKCDELWVFSGYGISDGMKIEIDIAERDNIPIKYFDDITLSCYGHSFVSY